MSSERPPNGVPMTVFCADFDGGQYEREASGMLRNTY
jgi:hypothetical protein